MNDGPATPVEAELVEPTQRLGWESAPVSAMAARDQPPVRWREILAVVALVVLCDATIYRGQGFAGLALLFVAAPALLWVGCYRPQCGWSSGIVGLLLLAIAAKMLWCVSWLVWLHVAMGFLLLVAFAMGLAGLPPYVLEGAVFASHTILAGYAGIVHYRRSANRRTVVLTRATWLNVALPVAAFLAFSVLFILANPDLLSSFGSRIERLLHAARAWIVAWSPRPSEFVFWVVVFWVSVGLLRPTIGRSLFEDPAGGRRPGAKKGTEGSESLVYTAYRNTLLTVIVLFGIYLAFEFKTLWFRVFPEGFYYSGYAHQGAAWLTLALGLATAILSFIFRGSVLQDPRLPALRRLAWLWSLENLLLAVAVYHRLYIYIGFNGMTRMRTVGFFGMSAVVAGFILVLCKIARNRDFVWLLRRHLWALAVAACLFVLTPVDWIVVHYNVRRILAGDPAPSVQISVHPIDAEGILPLEPLLRCDDPIVREGVAALLAQWHERAEQQDRHRRQKGWTSFQIADYMVLRRMRVDRSQWSAFADRTARDAALRRFHDYAYQWY